MKMNWKKHIKNYLIISFILITIFFFAFQTLCNYRVFSPKSTLKGELVSIGSTTWDDIDKMEYGYGIYPHTYVGLRNERDTGPIEKFQNKYRFDGAVTYNEFVIDDVYEFWYHEESRGSETTASESYDIYVIDAVTNNDGNTIWEAERSTFQLYDLGIVWYEIFIFGGFFFGLIAYGFYVEWNKDKENLDDG